MQATQGVAVPAKATFTAPATLADAHELATGVAHAKTPAAAIVPAVAKAPLLFHWAVLLVKAVVEAASGVTVPKLLKLVALVVVASVLAAWADSRTRRSATALEVCLMWLMKFGLTKS